jgi:tetratricopeptide (TPR) repeat protein
MKKHFFSICLLLLLFVQGNAQKNQIPALDLMLLRGEYKNLLDTCNQIILQDSLNPEIYYKMAIAWQNLLNEEMAMLNLQKATALNPEQASYRYALARALYNDGKFREAKPMFVTLCEEDSLHWPYSHYLSSILMLEKNYEEARRIYQRFHLKDTANHIFYDKTGFACLKNGDLDLAINWYRKSLDLNPRNTIAIKNLSWLYASLTQPETAIDLLTKGIETDSADLDLYVRRAQICFTKNWTKKALDDYLILLAAGDTTELYLKRAGIGYSLNRQPAEAIPFLNLAHQMDSTDYEICSYLGQCYFQTKDIPTSVSWYEKAIGILSAVNPKMALTYNLIGDSYKVEKSYRKAIDQYLKAFALNNDPNLNMVIANIYDESLNNRERAIFYYQKYLDTEKFAKMKMPPEYIQRVRERLIYLKQNAPK